MLKASTDDLRNGVLGDNVVLFTCLSFEERSLAVAECIAGPNLRKWFCFYNEDIEITIDNNHKRLHSLAARTGIEPRNVYTSRRDPLKFANELSAFFQPRPGLETEKWIVDITTMTHEMVLIFLAAIASLHPRPSCIQFVYNVAEEYSFGETAQERRWTSRGIREVRSVLGYAGIRALGSTSSLLALPGFDLERIQRVVDELEPERLFVGIAKPAMPDEGWCRRNKQLANALVSGRSQTGTSFEYPTLDIVGALEAILCVVPSKTDNVTVVPMNTKVSTIAVGALCLNLPHWQICYAPAIVYNINYARSSREFIVVPADEVFGAAKSVLGREEDLNHAIKS